MEASQFVKNNFNKSFSSWLQVAQQHNHIRVVANIRKVAVLSLEQNRKEIDANQLFPGLNKITIQHAQTSYRAAFLVATCTIEQLIAQWHTEGKKNKRAALLLAIISANPNHITNEMLYRFLISAEIHANDGWFQYGGNKTTAYAVMEENRKCTPEQFYENYQGRCY